MHTILHSLFCSLTRIALWQIWAVSECVSTLLHLGMWARFGAVAQEGFGMRLVYAGMAFCLVSCLLSMDVQAYEVDISVSGTKCDNVNINKLQWPMGTDLHMRVWVDEQCVETESQKAMTDLMAQQGEPVGYTVNTETQKHYNYSPQVDLREGSVFLELTYDGWHRVKFAEGYYSPKFYYHGWVRGGAVFRVMDWRVLLMPIPGSVIHWHDQEGINGYIEGAIMVFEYLLSNFGAAAFDYVSLNGFLVDDSRTDLKSFLIAKLAPLIQNQLAKATGNPQAATKNWVEQIFTSLDNIHLDIRVHGDGVEIIIAWTDFKSEARKELQRAVQRITGIVLTDAQVAAIFPLLGDVPPGHDLVTFMNDIVNVYHIPTTSTVQIDALIQKFLKGVSSQDVVRDELDQIYQEVLGRSIYPDTSGQTTWLGQLASGKTLAEVRRLIVNDPGGEAKAYLEKIYQEIWGRIDQPYIEHYTFLLELPDWTLADIVQAEKERYLQTVILPVLIAVSVLQ